MAERRSRFTWLFDEYDDRGFDDLVASLRRDDVASRPLAFVGAGVSAQAGYPTWGGLLGRLHDEASEADPDWAKDFKKFSSEENDYLWRAQEYRSRLGRKFGKILAEMLCPNGRANECASLLVSLPFRHILTTNFDTSLENAHAACPGLPRLRTLLWSDTTQLRDFLASLSDRAYERRYVYLHGRYSAPEDFDRIVFTEADYLNRYITSRSYSQKLFALLATQRIVFIGFSLTDPDLMAVFREANANLGHGQTRHFALLHPKGDRPRLATRDWLQRKFGIRPIFYRLSDRRGAKDRHVNLVNLLRQLREGVSATETVPAAAVGPAPSPLPPPARQAARRPMRSRSMGPDAPVTNTADPQKGRFGGHHIRDGRRLWASVEGSRGWYEISLEVSSTDGTKLKGPAKFYLHDTFRPSKITKWVVEDNTIVLDEVFAYGAFTVGVEVKDHGGRWTCLELDLADRRICDDDDFLSR